jgi:hypothetical protein
MGNTSSNCSATNGVSINDDGINTCYTESQIINVKNFQSVTIGVNSSAQAYTGVNGTGTLVPFNVANTTGVIQSIVITIHLSGGAITGIIIGSLLGVILLGILITRGFRYYKKMRHNRRIELDDMPTTPIIPYFMNEPIYPVTTDDIGEGMGDGMGGGYSRIRF